MAAMGDKGSSQKFVGSLDQPDFGMLSRKEMELVTTGILLYCNIALVFLKTPLIFSELYSSPEQIQSRLSIQRSKPSIR